VSFWGIVVSSPIATNKWPKIGQKVVFLQNWKKIVFFALKWVKNGELEFLSLLDLSFLRHILVAAFNY